VFDYIPFPKENELLFLIDTGADISLVKGNKLIGPTEYDPEKKVKINWVDGTAVKSHSAVESRIELNISSICTTFSW